VKTLLKRAVFVARPAPTPNPAGFVGFYRSMAVFVHAHTHIHYYYMPHELIISTRTDPKPRMWSRRRCCCASIFALPGALSLSAASDFLRLISRRKMDFTVTAGHQ
jgi:hypothetical protein